MRDLISLTEEEISEYIVSKGLSRFRGKQIHEWLHKKKVASVDEMTNIPKDLRAMLNSDFDTYIPKAIECQISKIDGTRKYLFELSDHQVVESVLMKYKHGNSVCISSQVGCKMGCRFCASTLDGWLRNLTVGEMLSQVYQIERDSNERVSNVVVMGTGEPLDNYDNLVNFVRRLSDKSGLNISQRNITVSTCGLVPRIYDLAKEDLSITLALSLHASSQEKREELMPIAKTYEIHDVLKACDDYFKETGRRISFEYSLVAGVNDTDEDARELHNLIRGMNCHVNLIPVNPIKERDYKQPSDVAVKAFKEKLERSGINVTIRREMGRDIDGACGQLRKKYMER